MNYTIHQKRFGKQTVSFSCEFCNEPLVAPLEDAGTQQPCPRCANPFTTPGEKELHAQQQAATDREHRARQAATEDRKKALAALEDQRRAERARTAALEAATPGNSGREPGAHASTALLDAPGGSPEPAPATTPHPPRYAILQITAHVIMILGILAAVTNFAVGLFSILDALFSKPGNDPFAQQLHSAMTVTGITFGILVIIAGLVTGIFTVAFAQLLLAVRDMAINSFHIRNAQ